MTIETKVYRKGKGSTREERGLELYCEKGSEIVRYLDRTFGVPSATEDGVVYVVDLQAGTCSCPNFVYRLGPLPVPTFCKHIYAAELYRAKAPAPPHELLVKPGKSPRRRRCCGFAKQEEQMGVAA